MKHVGTAASFRQCVLVTGFGAFPGARSNPTQAILAKLERQRRRLARRGIVLRCAVLPVVYAEIDAALQAAVAAHHPDAILHLGLAGRRHRVCVETRAVNRAGSLHPDAAGRRPASRTLVRGGRARLAATYPAVQTLQAIQRLGVPACLSIDAGDYVCNATLYHALSRRLAPRIGFLHVPRPRRPMQNGGETAAPTLEDLAAAALAAVFVIGRGACRVSPAEAGRLAPAHGSAIDAEGAAPALPGE